MTTPPESNKYLDKVASFLDKAIKFGDDLLGKSHGRLKEEVSILSKAESLKRTAKTAHSEMEAAKDRMNKARVKTGLGVAGVGTAGFLGLHKYHQHKDNAIMAKIDSMYIDPNK
jgi:hypothetical protein